MLPGIRQLFLVLGLLPLWGGCALRPIYAPAQREAVLPALAAIEVGAQYGRRDVYFRNYLIDELNPEGLTMPPEYDLAVTLRQQDNALAIQLDDSATRYNLIVGANFVLTRRTDGQVVYSSATRRVVSYNVRSDPFATMIAEQDAERRAAREVARQIRVILGLYFAEQAA